jgi:DNA-binding NarL/FixJ family response regulator
MTCRILVADGHWLTRRGLIATLNLVDDYQVVAEAADSHEAVARTLDLQPHVALFNLRLPGEGGVAAARLVKERRRQQKVVVLADRGGESSVRDALRAGCDGFVCTDVSDRELLQALRSVRNGDVYLDAELTRQMVLSDHRREMRASSGPLEHLSPRELDVFKLIGEGCTNRDAGERMQLSPKTVEKYRAAVMQKLKLRSAVDLRLLALELGVVLKPEAATPR